MASITTTIRDLNELSSTAQLACKLLFQECYKAGITDIFITETYRSQARQDYLYAQGRTRPGQIVTWTKSSNHTSRLAWDIAVAPPKSLYDVTTLTIVGNIAKKLDITWGGTWSNNIDLPHFEVKSNWVMPEGYKLEGDVIVPTSSQVRVQLIKKEELTVSQYEELKSEIEALKKELANKANSNSSATVGSSHKESYEWAKGLGLTDGSNPAGALTRQQLFTVLKRYHETFVQNNAAVSASHKEAWDKIISLGITDGSNPRALATREQIGTMLNRVINIK
ncbi:M15 family metallopeptidase [Lysinibacillus sp. SGAir0095]|uniref:M15 family metallopeptidase n=1 Tax=Lysinibacillus sp. SGAir0095 TaxID=2070463 RepID=UPI0010CCBE96|nr:M15 family metallopeptidase [Lysinibacillus sp. SGAir0095]QCR32592.1 peptidoglycan L-alanyl-D-glutamate endopeptidase [Lysinibacillus sp. SGAir0095]